jgi:L-aspartate oxidase
MRVNRSDCGTKDCDVLVVGSGIAGLTAAITAQTAGAQVRVLTLADVGESNSQRAQGGMAVATASDDSAGLHCLDTLACSADLAKPDAVQTLTAEAAMGLRWLEMLGLCPDHQDGTVALGLEGGHSRRRIVHAGGDQTGRAIQDVLSRQVASYGITVSTHTRVERLIVERGSVVGVEAIVHGRRRLIYARCVVLATGGFAGLFSRTTNPPTAVGDGIALAFDAGAELMDLEFVQFHPTALCADGSPGILISEAARGAGGALINRRGEQFMDHYHRDGDLAPRDVVTRAVTNEMRQDGASHVYLDMTSLGRRHLVEEFPLLEATCAAAGIDPHADPIPVAPAAHYCMGGVRADVWGRTSVPGLFAVGEVAATGVHGANRLASNSLLEGLVFGRRCGTMAASLSDRRPTKLWREPSLPQPQSRSSLGTSEDLRGDWNKLLDANWTKLGILRDGSDLARHQEWLRTTFDSVETSDDLPRAITVSRLVTESALIREESRGAHYRTDWPVERSRWRGHLLRDWDGFRFVPVEKSRLPDRTDELVAV